MFYLPFSPGGISESTHEVKRHERLLALPRTDVEWTEWV